MSLRTKTLVSIGVTLLCLIGVMYLVSSTIWLNGFAQVEDRDTRYNVQRLRDAIANELTVLDHFVSPWAAWDDTYAFIQDSTHQYIDANLQDATFTAAKLNLMLFVNQSGQIVFAKTFDFNRNTAVPVPSRVYTYLATGTLTRHSEEISGITGLIMLDEGPMLVAAWPIVKSDYSGPARGTLIIGRYLDADKIDQLQQITHLSVEVKPFDALQLSTDWQVARTALVAQSASSEALPAILVQPVSNDVIAGYTLLQDINDQPILLIRMTTTRDVLQQGRLGVSYLIGSLLIVGLVFAALTYWLLDHLLLRHIAQLSANVARIGTSRDRAGRVSTTGNDELTDLAANINATLTALEQAQRESEARYRDLFENAHDLIQSVDSKGRFLYVSRSWYEVLGYTPDEVPGLSLSDIIAPECLAECMEKFRQVMADQAVGRVETTFVTKDGHRILLEGSISCHVVDGQPLATRGIFRDITSRKQAEAELAARAREAAEASAFLNSVLENLPSGLFVKDAADLRFVRWNKANEELIGLSRDEVIGRNDHDFFPKDEADFFTAKDREVLANGQVIDIPEERIETRHKGARLLHTRKAPIYGVDGKPKYLLGISEDITERKQAEEMVRKLSRAVEQSPSTVMIIDAQANIEYVNPKFTQVSGYTLAEVLGRNPRSFQPDETPREVYEQMWRMIRTGREWHGEFRSRKKNGEPYWQSVSISPITNADDHITHFVAVTEDISERKRVEEAEHEQRVLAEALRDTAVAFSSDLGLDEILDRILANVGRVVPHEAANIMLVESGTAQIVHVRGYAERGLRQRSAPVEWRVTDLPNVNQITRTGSSVLIPDTQADPSWIIFPETEWIRSYIGVPIRNQDKVLGVLNLNSTTTDFFTPVHVERLIAFANQAAIVIENAQLLTDSRRRAERERMINQITNRIRGSMDIDAIIQTTVRELGQLVGASRCFVQLGADVNYMPIAHEFDQPGIEPFSERSGGLLPGTRSTVQTRSTLVFNDTAATAPQLSQLGVRAVLATPIIVHHDLLGVLMFHECLAARYWQLDEIELIEAIAAQVGVALENARLYDETRRQLSELAILHTAAIAAAGSSSLSEALQQVAQSVHDAFSTTHVAVMLIDADIEELVIRAGVGYTAADLQRIHLRVGQGVTGWVAQTGQPALLPDVTTDPRYLSVDDRIRSELCVPLHVGPRVIGVLNVESEKRDAFTERDLELMTTLGHNLSTIIENIRLLEEVRAANERLQELDRLKSQFLANMSHELRTPLNAIIGFSELIGDGMAGPLTPEQHEYIQHIHTSGQHLLRLINDILDLSKIQAGRMTLDWRDVDFADVVKEAQTIVTPIASRKQQLLSIAVPGDLPLVHIDPLRIMQVLINLLNNACKYTPDGGSIALRVKQTDDAGLLVSVGDTGRGIPFSQQAAIFEEFRQADNGEVKEEGTGLGLAIAQRLIELHGGRIWVESAGVPGLGSTFYFTLPVQPETAESTPTDRAAAPTVLIVEDDRSFSDLLALHLHQAGYRTRQCYNGGDAVPMIREVQPDLITLDMTLPERDGWSILREIKSSTDLRGIGVLVISGNESASTAITPGSVEYLSKPLLKSDLLEAVQRLKEPRPSRPLRILVVDDDPMLIELLQAILRPPDYEVITAINGTWAIEQLTSNLPDVIVLDLLMPDMNGFELVAALRSDPRTQDVPVLVLTAKSLSDGEQIELSRMVQGVMTKTSLRRERFLGEIRRLERMRATASPLSAS